MAEAHQSSRKTLMEFPHEILNAIFREVRIHDLANLAATSKAIKAYIEPELYCKMYTQIGTSHDTAALVGLLTRRPEIVPWVKALVVDEYHPCHTRQLLAIEMPNLWCILIQHEGQPVEDVSETEKRALNQNIVAQPKLLNFVFWIECLDNIPYRLSKDDAALFKQPALDRLRLSNVDFAAFQDVDESHFVHKDLQNIMIEGSHYTPTSLHRLLSPPKALTTLTLQNQRDPPIPPPNYLPLLSSATTTLKILKLEWRYTRSNHIPAFSGLDLTPFTALRLLRIQPGTLFGPGGGGEGAATSYTTPSNPNLVDLIRHRLPPGLKVLLLESITVPPPIAGLTQELLPMDVELIRCLIERKAEVAPRLKFIFLYYLEEMTEPEGLYDLADKHGMRLNALYRSEAINWKAEDLDADEYISSDGKLMQW